MKHATVILNPGLIFFLPKSHNGIVDCWFQGNPSVKHLIESIGVPHTEVGSICSNSLDVDFDYLVQDGDAIKVFPYSSFNQEQITDKLSSNLSIEINPGQFILDNHLGRLNAYLRMLGFDCLYNKDWQDDTLAILAWKENRILLTRDRRLLMRKIIQKGLCIRSLNPHEQVREVLERFNLYGKYQPFSRCLRCNHELKPVSKETVIDQLEPLTRRYFDEFHQCSECGQVYWKGSHYDRMLTLINTLIDH